MANQDKKVSGFGRLRLPPLFVGLIVPTASLACCWLLGYSVGMLGWLVAAGSHFSI